MLNAARIKVKVEIELVTWIRVLPLLFPDSFDYGIWNSVHVRLFFTPNDPQINNSDEAARDSNPVPKGILVELSRYDLDFLPAVWRIHDPVFAPSARRFSEHKTMPQEGWVGIICRYSRSHD